MSKYLHIFSSVLTTSISSSVMVSGYVYKNLIHLIPSILQSFFKSSGNFAFPYKSIPYLPVSCAITINSFIPFFANISASSNISSSFLDMYFP